jgi:hypothetical protein
MVSQPRARIVRKFLYLYLYIRAFRYPSCVRAHFKCCLSVGSLDALSCGGPTARIPPCRHGCCGGRFLPQLVLLARHLRRQRRVLVLAQIQRPRLLTACGARGRGHGGAAAVRMYRWILSDERCERAPFARRRVQGGRRVGAGSYHERARVRAIPALWGTTLTHRVTLLRGTTHSYATCSNRGACDSATGECACFPGTQLARAHRHR